MSDQESHRPDDPPAAGAEAADASAPSTPAVTSGPDPENAQALSEQEAAPSAADPDPSPAIRPAWWAERPETVVEVPRARLAAQSRRSFLLWTAGVLATAAGAWWLLPDRAKSRLAGGDPARDWLDTLAARVGLSRARREALLDRGLTFDDDVAEALFSVDRRVRTYRRSEVTALRNNYHGRTPGPEILPGWSLEISGLASQRVERLSLAALESRLARREQVTRLVCVEGWSAIAWWGGLRFADLLQAYPPASGARWAEMRSMVSMDGAGRHEPYYVSLDLETARHPQTLLVTHHNGRPLSLAHGAPLRLIAPMKLGLKNIKAITHITYQADEPPDYWNERGYSSYDGL